MATSAEHRALVAAIQDGLAEAADACRHADCNDLDWGEIVHVSDFAVGEAMRCQAKLAGPESPFEPDIFKTFKAVALRSVRYLDDVASPREAVSRCMRDLREERDWIGNYLHDVDLGVRVQIATRAVTWLSRTLDVLGRDNVGNFRTADPVQWRYPERGLKLAGKIDLVHGVAGGQVPHIVIPSRSEANDAKVAFLTTVWCASKRHIPAEVVVLAHATGERYSVAPSDVFAHGIEAAASATRALAQRGQSPDGLQRSPSHFTCGGCAWRDDCPDFAAHQLMPPMRGGVRLALD